MYKASMELCQVTKYLKLKFGIILKGDVPNTIPMVSTFEKDGNQYLSIKPHPFITVDISNTKERPWTSNQSFTISGMSKYLFTKRLREIRMELLQDKELFFTRNGKLYVNQELAKKHAKPVPVGKGKTCLFIPIVVEDEVTGDEFEGISMMINSPENYSNFTFEEMEFLIDYLERLDLDILTLNLLTFVMQKHGQTAMANTLKELQKTTMFGIHKLNELEKNGDNENAE